MQGSL